MKGNQELVDALNGLLASELTSINQYMVHAEMAEDWGYTRLSENFKKRSITEMKHAERLIERILFLEGTPIVSHLNDMHIGAEIPQQVNNDHALELDAIRQYNEAIVLAGQVLDYATRDILEAILRDEDTHLDELEELQDQIEQMTLPTFFPRRTSTERRREDEAGSHFTEIKREPAERWLTTGCDLRTIGGCSKKRRRAARHR